MQATFIHDNLRNRRVFVRADLNVTFVEQHIVGDDRLQQILPTLDKLILMGAKIILATHLGRPKKYALQQNYSTVQLLNWFRERKYAISFAHSLQEAHQDILPGHILLLENLRVYDGEKRSKEMDKNTEIAWQLAKQLRNLADYYINDAFGLLHRNDTSITLLPQLFDAKDKSIGLLVEKELKILTPIRDTPKKPYVLVIGGGKVADKLPAIEQFLTKVTCILICPAISFTFMRAMNLNVGKSLVAENLVPKALEIIQIAALNKVKLLLPVDYLIATDNLEGPLSLVTANEIPENGIGLSIGPKTIKLFSEALSDSQTVYVNGAMGIFSRPETMVGLNVLLQTIAQLTNTSIIGGGESVTAVHQLGIQDAIAYCSTGGGATLHYLAGDILPGLISIK